MPTKRLYRTESYLTRFDSEVMRLEPDEDGSVWVLLAATLFYPAAGGQPNDTGRLGDAQVLKVEERGDEVWHLVRGRLPEPGERVAGTVDWQRRYRHMQRHSAQHLLSQAFIRADPDCRTVSVSMAGPACTLDLTGQPDEAVLERAERLAAEAAYANYPIRCFEVDERDVGRYGLRREPKVSGRIRLVQMGDWEIAACGGTHLKSTAEAGPIKLLRSQRVRGGLTRVYFCSGWEALEDYALKHEVTAELALDFSAQASELPVRVRALEQELGAARREETSLRLRLAEQLAASLLERAEAGRDSPIVVCEEIEDDLLRPVAKALCVHEGVIALLGAAATGGATLLFARGAGSGADMAALLDEALPHVEGRGGGRADMAQGKGSRAEGLKSALDAARKRLLAE